MNSAEIPEEQLKRVRPVVDKVLEELRIQIAEMPDDAPPSVDFYPGFDECE